jgi:hypothetical protein
LEEFHQGRGGLSFSMYSLMIPAICLMKKSLYLLVLVDLTELAEAVEVLDLTEEAVEYLPLENRVLENLPPLEILVAIFWGFCNLKTVLLEICHIFEFLLSYTGIDF